MARSRREQREQLQQEMQSEPQQQSTDPSPFSQRPTLSPDSSAYRELVAIAAYYRAERRGFAPGGEVDDWLAAEREVASGVGESRAM